MVVRREDASGWEANRLETEVRQLKPVGVGIRWSATNLEGFIVPNCGMGIGLRLQDRLDSFSQRGVVGFRLRVAGRGQTG